MSELKFLLSDLDHLRRLAKADRNNRVVVSAIADQSFVVLVRAPGEASGRALSSPTNPASPQLFTDLAECVRTAVELSVGGHVFFDMPY